MSKSGPAITNIYTPDVRGQALDWSIRVALSGGPSTTESIIERAEKFRDFLTKN